MTEAAPDPADKPGVWWAAKREVARTFTAWEQAAKAAHEAEQAYHDAEAALRAAEAQLPAHGHRRRNRVRSAPGLAGQRPALYVKVQDGR